MSLENLFNILPDGFVSKKKTGAFRTACSIESCRFAEESNSATKRKAAREIDRKNSPPTSPAKM